MDMSWWRKRTVETRVKRARSLLHRYHDVDDEYDGLTVNPYVGCSHRCVYCYATFEWKGDFHDIVDVKINAAEVLVRELAMLKRRFVEPVFLSTVTDPYQPIEGVYRLTRRIVEVLQSRGIPYYIFTKSASITRDLDLHARYRDRCAIVWSLTTLDEGIKRLLEPGASAARGVLEAMRRFSEADVPVGINIDPVIPGLTDGRGRLEELVERAADSGARFVYNGVLRLREDIWERFRELLIEEGLTEAYQRLVQLYFRDGRRAGPYRVPPRDYQEDISRRVRKTSKKRGLYYGIPVGEGELIAPAERWRIKPLTCYMQQG